MSRLTRYTQKIFGSNASANQMAQYGSLAASAPMLYSGSTITPTIVQSLGEYLDGWFSAVIAQNSPAIEDMNALFYLFAYQLTYLMQVGIPEWDSGTTYYTGDIVQSSGVIYASLTNSNLNNAITDGTNWTSSQSAGLLTPNAVPYATGMTLSANESMTWPNMSIGSGQTVVVPNNATLIGITKIVVSGTGMLQATGTGVIRII
jgi:hypothetical protein